MQPPEGPPICAALKLLAAGHAAADVVDDLAQRLPMGTSTRPVLLIVPARAKTLVPLLFAVPMRGEPLRAVHDDRRDVGVGLHVVDEGRLAPEALLTAGKGGRGRGSPRLPSMEVDQGRLLAADEGAGAHPDFHVEVELRCPGCSSPAGRTRAPARWPCRSRSTARGYSARM